MSPVTSRAVTPRSVIAVRRRSAMRVAQLRRVVLGGLLAAGAAVGCTPIERERVAADMKTAAARIREAVTPAAAFLGHTSAQAAQRMKQYLQEKDTLKTFHDAAGHSEAALLAFLRQSGAATATADSAARGKTAAAGTRVTRSIDPQAGTAASGAFAPGVVAVTEAPSTTTPAVSGWRWPVDAGIVSSEYGSRWGRRHHGIDIAARTGEPVYATAAGDVIYAGNRMSGYGNAVILRHGNGLTTLYAHNSELKVVVGDRVQAGTLIALLGSTGHSTGPHVHYEIRRGETAIDPRSMLAPSMLADGPAGQPLALRR
ncbi:MAG: M23 family metallopeptidase [Lautropia sp.]